MINVYLDYAATTPVDPRVLKGMMPFFTEKFGNTMSFHDKGVEAVEEVERARKIIAEFINAAPEEIIFTSSATESNNLALKGIAWANKHKGNHIIISRIEHDCVLNAAKWLETQGFEVTRVSVDKFGFVNLTELERAIRPNTILVSIIHGNNEIGTIQDIREIGKICRRKKVLFHTDAAQSFGKVTINVEKDNIDLLTASSHKIYGPKGAAILYLKKGITITPLLHGGGHENNLRSSTVNVPAIVGMGKAVEICLGRGGIEGKGGVGGETKRTIELRDKLINGILEKIPHTKLNGHPTKRLPNNVNISFAFVEGESLLLELNMAGIYVSTGSACSSRNLEPSHVLLAIGLRHEEAHGSLRFSLGRWTSEKEIDYVLQVLPGIVAKLRKISPFHR